MLLKLSTGKLLETSVVNNHLFPGAPHNTTISLYWSHGVSYPQMTSQLWAYTCSSQVTLLVKCYAFSYCGKAYIKNFIATKALVVKYIHSLPN